MEKISFLWRIWSEGKYFDLWNLPHFLISAIIGFIFIFLELKIAYSILLIIFIKTSWEILEHRYIIKEHIPNKIFDILTGVIAIIFVYFLNNYFFVNMKNFIILCILAIVFGGWGLYSIKKLDGFIS